MIAAASSALLLVVWAAGAAIYGDASVLPSPQSVAVTIGKEAASGALWVHLGATLARVVAAFAIAMSVGCLLGFVMGRVGTVNLWADPWLIAFLNLPALVAIVLAYIWIGLNEVAAISAVAANKIPMVTVMMREGARTLDPRLDDMGRVFGMPPLARVRHILLPQLAPHIASSGRAGIALIWKIVLVVEFLGRGNGIGFQIHLYFQLFDVRHVLAYAISFIVVMLLVEYLILQPWERRTTRWRRNED